MQKLTSAVRAARRRLLVRGYGATHVVLPVADFLRFHEEAEREGPSPRHPGVTWHRIVGWEGLDIVAADTTFARVETRLEGTTVADEPVAEQA